MFIKDLHGKKIEVTDLEEAIVQAERFSGYDLYNDEPLKGALLQLKHYWADVYKKLIRMEKRINNKKIEIA